MNRKVLVVGATGVAGSAFVTHIRKHQSDGLCDWQLIGVTRGAQPVVPVAGGDVHDSVEQVSYITADLLSDYQSIAALSDITHVVFAGFVPAPDFASQVAPNREILLNCLRALESNPLERVVLIQGMKYYGSHLGPFKTPAREDDPRHDGENYYYAQQDELERSGVDWTCLRPHVICGTTSIGTPQNILSVIGVYASLMRETAQPLTWPGTAESFHAINQATDANLLAKAIAWSIDTPEAAKQAFNITNGDFFRWQHLWPQIANLFAVEAGGVSTRDLSTVMPALTDRWNDMVNKYDLKPSSMDSIVNWPFADYILRTGWDVMANTVKIRQCGFHDCLDTEQMYLQHLSKLQNMRILPR